VRKFDFSTVTKRRTYLTESITSRGKY